MKKRKVIIVLATAILVTACVAGTLAYMGAQVGYAQNAFSPKKIVNIGIVENRDQKEIYEQGEVREYASLTSENNDTNPVEKTVWIKNLDKPKDRVTDVYIRAAIIPIWRSADMQYGTGRDVANVCLKLAADDASTAGSWQRGSDGYYYFTAKVIPGQRTDQLLAGVYLDQITAVIEGEDLEVQVLADGVEADPAAVQQSWGDVASVGPDGLLKIK